MVLGASSRDIIAPGAFPTEPEKGWFQACYIWNHKPGSFGAGFEVCAKQTFYQKTTTIDCASQGPHEITQNIPHNSITQVHNLTMERACLVWAFVKYILNILELSKGLNPMFPPSADGMS